MYVFWSLVFGFVVPIVVAIMINEMRRLQAFFKDRAKQVSGAERGLAQTTEATTLCHALVEKQDAKAILR